jgi:hypothetical protein
MLAWSSGGKGDGGADSAAGAVAAVTDIDLAVGFGVARSRRARPTR